MCCFFFKEIILVCVLFSIAVIKTVVLLAVNQEYVGSGDTLELHEGDEVAVIPPISGG